MISFLIGIELLTLRPLTIPSDYGNREANPDCSLLQCKNTWLLAEKLKIQRWGDRIVEEKRVQGTGQCKSET